MTIQRRSYETGHKPKCLVIVDDTAEWDRAVYYASRWAMRAGGGVVMLRIIETEDQNQQWLGVADIMRAEALEDANAALDRASGRVNGIAEVLAHPQVAARQLVREVDSPVGRIPIIGSPLRLSDSAERLDRLPALGEDTEPLLHEIGCTDADVARLRRDGVI